MLHKKAVYGRLTVQTLYLQGANRKLFFNSRTKSVYSEDLARSLPRYDWPCGCWVCGNTRATNPSASFHCVPEDPSLRAVWIKAPHVTTVEFARGIFLMQMAKQDFLMASLDWHPGMSVVVRDTAPAVWRLVYSYVVMQASCLAVLTHGAT